VFDGAGKQEGAWPVKFSAQAINCGPDGQVYVAGDGRIAAFDSSGKQLNEVELPHVALIAGDSEKIRKRAEEQKQQEIESYEEMLKEQQKLIDEYTKKDPDFADNLKKLESEQKTLAELRAKLRQAQVKKEDTAEIQKSITEQTAKIREMQKSDSSKLTAAEKQQLRQAEAISKSYKTMLERQKSQNIDDVVKQLTSRLKLVNAVAVTEKDVYVVSGETKGYGYAVWRMDRSFQNPKQVMSGVRGCCGQMDIQAVGDELWVAQNCDHKVGRYDRDGKLIKTMGKRGRDGDADCFGGCCNPMNIRLNKDLVYTAESEGIVRCFTVDGDNKGVIGSVKLSGGCKNVALAVSPDGNTVYFCDQPGSKIHIMTKKPDPAKGAE
jgi:ribosomal protein L24E